MKNIIIISGVLLTIILVQSCKKDEPAGTVSSCLTQEATNVSASGATLNGTVNANDLSTLVTFEYGITTGYYYYFPANPYAVTGDTPTHVSADIWYLLPGTLYHFRLKAVNSFDTIYSEDATFTTLEINPVNFNPDLTYGSVSDIDGNTYKTIQIGTQTWVAENLKTTKYNDGTAIPNIKGSNAWGTLSTGAYCDYNNFPSYSAIYGRLYNWYVAASTNTKNVCPAGWHVPSVTELTVLLDYLGGESVAGDKLKEAGSAHWPDPNTGATNESGFTALPGGGRFQPNSFSDVGSHGSWWLSTEYDAANGEFYHLSFSGESNGGYFPTDSGLSVRCIKDN
jgi:uncharacterized protein (TIGR02145 family)